ncbi:MAG TPA: hypothetical protein VFB12_33370, partial [Ktedonobacteraceae bacterium]|nr:hypothetical protein [Ktedonobacteraceae bacterium]
MIKHSHILHRCKFLCITLMLTVTLVGCTLPGADSNKITLTSRGTVVAATDPHVTQYVNPFVGTSPGGSNFGFGGDSGDTFPGAAYPLGMVQWSPDTPSNLPGGYYYPDTTIKGFSLTHFSG